MNINTNTGNVHIRFSDARMQRNLSSAQKKLNMQVVADCTPYVPFLNGALRSQVDYPKGIDGDEIEWNTPYAHYQYYGELYLASNGSSWARYGERKYPTGRPLQYKQPGTGKKWFEKAKSKNKSKWINLARQEVGRN